MRVRGFCPRRGIARGLVLSAFLCLVFVSKPARGERPGASSPLGWIQALGPIAFNRGGGALLPLSVLESLKDGEVSPIMQFVLVNSMMNKCIKDVIKYHPRRRDPYKLAKAKFDYGVCRIQKCFQQAMLVLVLPQLSTNRRNGGSEDEGQREGAKGLAMVLAGAFKKNPACDGGKDSGMDMALISILAGGGGGGGGGGGP